MVGAPFAEPKSDALGRADQRAVRFQEQALIFHLSAWPALRDAFIGSRFQRVFFVILRHTDDFGRIGDGAQKIDFCHGNALCPIGQTLHFRREPVQIGD